MDDWKPYVKTVGPASFHAMTCGPIPPNPPELLGSERFVRLLAELRESYDWVLLDSPPAMSLADAVLLSSKVDMVLLVVQHNQTDRDLAARTVFQFRNVGANIAGAVLNNVNLEREYRKDYYYAGYYYESDDKKTTKSRRSGEPKSGAGAGAMTS
jgi:Mrp family chromosome partitioning ATPase